MLDHESKICHPSMRGLASELAHCSAKIRFNFHHCLDDLGNDANLARVLATYSLWAVPNVSVMVWHRGMNSHGERSVAFLFMMVCRHASSNQGWVVLRSEMVQVGMWPITVASTVSVKEDATSSTGSVCKGDQSMWPLPSIYSMMLACNPKSVVEKLHHH